MTGGAVHYATYTLTDPRPDPEIRSGTAAGTWHSYAVRFDLAGGYLRIYVDEELRGVVNLATFHGGALLGELDASTNDFVSVGYAQAAFGTPGWSDNFQVGTP